MSDIITISKDAAGNVVLENPLAVLLASASEDAYSDKTQQPGSIPAALLYPNSSFTFVKRFTGFDDVAWGSGKEERFGLIYQWSENKDVYLVAFRGTASVYDMILDLESATTTTFSPYEKDTSFPSDVHVGDGFNKIYATKSSSMTASMQQQLFDYFAPLNPAQIIITGHSLGSALASLFALDLAVSLPQTSVLNINFASPRVGAAKWQTTYNQTYNLQNYTVAIRNSYDLVPKVPPSEWPFDFTDVGNLFPVAFTVANYHIDFGEIVLAWHSLRNYGYVLNNATLGDNRPQVWTGDFVDQAYPTWEMVSYNPYTTTSAIEKAQDRNSVRNLVHEKRS